MKFAHISDLHINTYFRDSNLEQTKILLDYFNSVKVDHLLLTGDLTDNADELNLDILRKSLNHYGFKSGEKISIIPGNHDIYGGVQKPEDLFSFPERCRKTNYDKKLQTFNQIMNQTFDNVLYRSSINGYPYAKIIGDVLIIGVDSNDYFSPVSNPFASNGKVSKDEQKEIEIIVSKYGRDVNLTIMLIHHHFNQMHTINHFSAAGLWQNIEKQTMKLRKKKSLIELFKNCRVDLVLHGHLHETLHYVRQNINFLNAGGSIKNNLRNSITCNIIDTENNNVNFQIIEIPLADRQFEDFDSIISAESLVNK
ncbi:MAG TPA: metallophosphoesterase [Ignavibacteriaceae bacterium]|nr:metallophosphoesterase [Ignavibacteriaceae bacterium]